MRRFTALVAIIVSVTGLVTITAAAAEAVSVAALGPGLVSAPRNVTVAICLVYCH